MVSQQTATDTVTVDVLDEELTGVIPLGEMPPVGAIVEVEARGDLLVIPIWYEGPPVVCAFEWLHSAQINHDSTPWDDGGIDYLHSGGEWDAFCGGLARVGDKVLAVYFDSKAPTGSNDVEAVAKCRYVNVTTDGAISFSTPTVLYDTATLYPGGTYYAMYLGITQVVTLGDRAVVMTWPGNPTHGQITLSLVDCSGAAPVLLDTEQITPEDTVAPYVGQAGPDHIVVFNELAGLTYKLHPFSVATGSFAAGTPVTASTGAQGDRFAIAASGYTDGRFMFGMQDNNFQVTGTLNPSTLAISGVTVQPDLAGVADSRDFNVSFGVLTPAGGLVDVNDQGDIREIGWTGTGTPTVGGVYDAGVATYTTGSGAKPETYGIRSSGGRGTGVGYDPDGVAWAAYATWNRNASEVYDYSFHLVRDVFGTPTEVLFDQSTVPGLDAFFADMNTLGVDEPYMTLVIADGIGLVSLHASTAGAGEVAEPWGKYVVMSFRACPMEP